MVRPLLVTCVIAIAAHGRAQVLHEKVVVGSLRCAGGICVSESGQAKAIEQDGQTLYSPGGGPQPEPGEQVFSPQPDRPVEVGGAGGDSSGDRPPDRRDVIRSDRDTGPEGPGTHIYHVVFNPDPFPYKRMTALDAVRIGPCTFAGAPADCDDELLEVHDRGKRPLPVVGPQRAEGRDAFWGSIVVDLEPGKWVPIPSVAADLRILAYHTTPSVAVEFARDGGDNVFVRSPSGGRHRLNWLSDAPQRYFAGELPSGVTLAEMPPSLVRDVPDRLRLRVKQVLARAGIGRVIRYSTQKIVRDPLVSYFRAFEVGTLPPPSGSSYLDLAMAQKGCCRHRSFAFAITAMHLGIPVRYIENEVHVFVEVFVPRMGWRRVNLGGAPINEELVGGEGKTLYRDKGGDPFPQPAAFLKDAAPPPKGLEKLGQAGQQSSPQAGQGGQGGQGSQGSQGGQGANGKGPGESSSQSNPLASIPDPNSGPPRIDLAAVEREDAAASSTRANRRARTQIDLTLENVPRENNKHATFRGDTVAIGGTVTAENGDAGGLAIEIYLDRPGGAIKIADATTAGDGRYSATIEVPKTLPLGDHRVVARCKGDARRAPSSTSR
jgi:hypothetical protein